MTLWHNHTVKRPAEQTPRAQFCDIPLSQRPSNQSITRAKISSCHFNRCPNSGEKERVLESAIKEKSMQKYFAYGSNLDEKDVKG